MWASQAPAPGSAHSSIVSFHWWQIPGKVLQVAVLFDSAAVLSGLESRTNVRKTYFLSSDAFYLLRTQHGARTSPLRMQSPRAPAAAAGVPERTGSVAEALR